MNQFKFSKWSPPTSMHKLTLFIMLFEVRSRNLKNHLQKWFVLARSVGECLWRLNFLKSLNLSCLVTLCKVSFLTSTIWNLFLSDIFWKFSRCFEFQQTFEHLEIISSSGIYLKLSPVLKTSSQYSICCSDVDKFFLPISC